MNKGKVDNAERNGHGRGPTGRNRRTDPAEQTIITGPAEQTIITVSLSDGLYYGLDRPGEENNLRIRTGNQMSEQEDLENAITAGVALWDASNGKITQPQLAIMLAICGQQSNWTNVVQNNGVGNPAYIGWGLWQITPGDVTMLDPRKNADLTWQKMQEGANTAYGLYEAWNLEADGKTLIWPTGELPSGEIIREYPPSEYQYQIGLQAAREVWKITVGGKSGMIYFVGAAQTEQAGKYYMGTITWDAQKDTIKPFGLQVSANFFKAMQGESWVQDVENALYNLYILGNKNP